MLLSKAEILLLLLSGACQAAESRLLSSSNRSSTSNYGQYANASSGHPYLSIFLGVVLSAAIFTGFVFLVDRETFDEVVGQKLFCKCTRCRSTSVSVHNSCSCCNKPDIDDDDDYGVPNISPEFITPETAEYLSNKHEEEAERPKKMWRETQKWVRDQSSKCLVPVKKYLPKSFVNSNGEIQLPEIFPKQAVADKLEVSDEDKYYIRDLHEIPSEEQSLEDKVAYQLWEMTEKVEDARVKMFWTPTRDLDKVMDGKDKYNVKGESKEFEIQCNSWFEEDEDAPWS